MILVLAWAAFTMTSLDRSVWGPAAPSVGQALGVALASLGVFATCYYVGYVVSNFLGGLASDWVGPRVVLTASMVLAGAGMVFFGSVQSFALGLLAQALVGFFAGADYAAGAKSISAWFSGRERTFAVGLFTTATSLGTVVANLVVPTMIAEHGWRLSYHLFGAISIVLGLVIAVLHRSRPPQAAGTELATPAAPHTPRLGRVLGSRDLIVLGIAGFFSLWGTYGFITWSNTLMIQGKGIDPVHAGGIVALFAITAVIMKPVIGLVAGRIRFHRKYLAAGILVLFAIMLLIFGTLGSLPAFYIAAPVLGFAAYCYSPIQNALILDYAGAEEAGSAAGTLNAVWQLGSVVVPTVVGAIFAATDSVYSAFVTLAIGPLLAALLMLPLSGRFRSVAPEDVAREG
ncbi:MFS transporter [Brachybacterium endophyticum]|uniref:MFS transporter n=1 Tax=Brachybacterium endophyticum TaxID=2182385 RepID=A0A2U2RK70_9MICO|nr:MFS transporter [Brachybacterium endophyticum]